MPFHPGGYRIHVTLGKPSIRVYICMKNKLLQIEENAFPASVLAFYTFRSNFIEVLGKLTRFSFCNGCIFESMDSLFFL